MKLRRDIRRGMIGADVFAVQRALIHDGIRRRRASRHFGRRCERQVKRFQRMRGLQPDGVVGEHTIRVMQQVKRNHKPILDGFCVWCLQHGRIGRPDKMFETKRMRAVRLHWWFYAHGSLFGYLQIRPMANFRCPPQVNFMSDCSELEVNAAWCVGAPDPSGYHYSGWGNTYSMIANAANKIVHEPRPGDLIFYDNPSHVAMYVGGGRVISHGSPGVHLLPMSYRPVAHIRSYLP